MSADTSEINYKDNDNPRLEVIETLPGTHKEEVVRVLHALEVPLLTATRDTYEEIQPGRGWNICGPAWILALNFTSALTGVPISVDKNDPNEHIELDVTLYDPRKVGVSGEPDDNTIFKYTTGVPNELIVIEGVCSLTSGVLKEPKGAFRMLILDTSRDDLDKRLEDTFGLYRFSEQKARELALSDERGNIATWPTYQKAVTRMNSSQVFVPEVKFLGQETSNRDYWGHNVRRAAGLTIQLVEQTLPPGTLDITKLKTVPHIMPSRQIYPATSRRPR